MRTVTEIKTIYKFDELGEYAKQNALSEWHENGLDYEWYDCVYEDAKEIGRRMGIKIDKIFFSGFSCQGDGACFEGEYAYAKGCQKAVRDYAPVDEELHRIVDTLVAIQRPHFYQLSARVKQSGHYLHRFCTSFGVYKADPVTGCDDNLSYFGEDARKDEENLIETIRDFMLWIYRQLESEYDVLSSMEYFQECALASQWEFSEDGEQV